MSHTSCVCFLYSAGSPVCVHGGAEPSTASRQRGDLSEMTAAGGAGAKKRVLNGLFRSDSLQSPLCAGRSGNRAAQITSCMHILYICRPGQCQRRNCGGSDGNRTSIYRDSFNFNKTVELTARAPVSLQSN